MRMTYRTKRRLRGLGLALLTLTVVLLVVWFCSVIWLERYVVYSSDGARLDFENEPAGFAGVEAVKPEAQGGVSIFYNEGSDAISISKDLTPISGYYLDYASMVKDMAGAMENLEVVPVGTPILVDMKGGYGTFYYSSTISGAVQSASAPVQTVDEFVKKLRSKGYYMIARVSAFRDYDFGNRNVTSGLYMKSRAGLWMDSGGCFWLDPTSANTLSWITSIVNEIRDLGFKPYVAPAVSSGAMQLLLTLRGDWHCSSVPLGDVWFGVKNRFTPQGLEVETLSLPDTLFARLQETETLLKAIV